MSKELRDQIRSATVGAKKRFSSESVNVPFTDIKVEVRQLSLSDRRDYMQSSIDSKTNSADILKLQVNAIIASCYVPGTDSKVYEDTDYKSISDSVTGGYADTLWEAVQRLSNFTVDDAKKN